MMLGRSQGDSALDVLSDPFQAAFKGGRIKLCFHGQHAAADVHAYGGRDDGVLCRNDGPDGRPDAEMDVRHDSDVFEHAREVRRIDQLIKRLRLDIGQFAPYLNGHTTL